MHTKFTISPSNQLRTLSLSGSEFGTIGIFTYGEANVALWDNQTRLDIGKFCSLANSFFYLGGNHRVDWISTYPFSAFKDQWVGADAIIGHPASKGNIVIGNDVWIGDKASILSGVTMGNGAVASAGAMVTKNVPAYHIASGNPANHMRPRFPEAQIELLEEIKWWDWPLPLIHKHMPTLCSGDFDALRRAWDSARDVIAVFASTSASETHATNSDSGTESVTSPL